MAEFIGKCPICGGQLYEFETAHECYCLKGHYRVRVDVFDRLWLIYPPAHSDLLPALLRANLEEHPSKHDPIAFIRRVRAGVDREWEEAKRAAEKNV